jgi:hypothetical protein
VAVVDPLEIVDVDEQQSELALVQAGLVEPARGHVLLHAQVLDHAAVGVTRGHERDLVPERRAVGPVVEDRHVRVGARCDGVTENLDGTRIGVRSLQDAALTAQNVGGGVAGELLEAGADVREGAALAGRVSHDDAGDLDLILAPPLVIGQSDGRP